MINILLAGPYQVKGLSEKTMIWSYQKAWLFNLKLKFFLFLQRSQMNLFSANVYSFKLAVLKKVKGLNE